MKIDNTIFSIYSKCPQMYWERYEAPNEQLQDVQPPDKKPLLHVLSSGPEAPSVAATDPNGLARGIELDQPSEGRDFGSRLHQLLHERRLQQLGTKFERQSEWPDEAIEAEAQATLAAYEAHYVHDYEYLESERTSVLLLPILCPCCGGKQHTTDGLSAGRYRCQGSPEGCGTIYSRHELIVKLDAVVRHLDGTIGPMDTKTENKPGYNTREDWAGRTQAKIYLWALEKLYPAERVSRLVVDVVQRASPKAHRGPIFTRLDDISSPPEAIQEAIRNLIWVAHDIEESRKRGWWRSNMNLCKKGWERCDYYFLHVNGRTEANLKKYRPAEDYLSLND